MERLDCTCNNYAWGKYGEDSEVARLYAAGHPEFQTDGSKPYSEVSSVKPPVLIKTCTLRPSDLSFESTVFSKDVTRFWEAL